MWIESGYLYDTVQERFRAIIQLLYQRFAQLGLSGPTVTAVQGVLEQRGRALEEYLLLPFSWVYGDILDLAEHGHDRPPDMGSPRED